MQEISSKNGSFLLTLSSLPTEGEVDKGKIANLKGDGSTEY